MFILLVPKLLTSVLAKKTFDCVAALMILMFKIPLNLLVVWNNKLH